MPKIKIDGQEVSVPNGTTVIQAAEKAGTYIPRYCYHPGLSIAGSCRMCLVEVENMPNLQIACYSRVQDGMEVTTDSERVKKARQGMLEFLLSDHPLDCPVCDQSGECDLQNFYMEHGRYQSKFLENKIKRKKAFSIGPHVMLDQERCILCTRCTRFTEEVSKSNELGVFNRGDRSVIDLFPGKTLDNPYSGNVIDICPVGALTEKEFRFQCRVWYLKTEESICQGCSRGCNINIHYNESRAYKAGGRRVMRIKPRFNPDVNQWWICDQGRFGYRFIDEDRIESPYLREEQGLDIASWSEALGKTAELIRTTIEAHGTDSVGVIFSPQLSNEDLLMARKLFVEGLEIENLALDNPWEEPGDEDDFLMRADRNPNRAGGERLGLGGSADRLLKKAAAGEIQLLYIFWHDFPGEEVQEQLRSTPKIIFHGVNWNSTAELADVILAGVTHAEKDGTFTNCDGLVQPFTQALLPIEDSRNDTEILKELAAELNVDLPDSAEEAFTEWLSASAPVGSSGQEGDTGVQA